MPENNATQREDAGSGAMQLLKRLGPVIDGRRYSLRYLEREGRIFLEAYDGAQEELPPVIVEYRELPSGETERVQGLTSSASDGGVDFRAIADLAG